MNYIKQLIGKTVELVNDGEYSLGVRFVDGTSLGVDNRHSLNKISSYKSEKVIDVEETNEMAVILFSNGGQRSRY